MTIPLESRRIVIAGASSLFGAELKALLEESRFAACDFRLVDEEIVAGTLTEAGGEAAVIQPVEDDSFHKAWAVFFTGSPAFTKRNLRLAQRSGAVIVDLSGELAGTSGARSGSTGRVAGLHQKKFAPGAEKWRHNRGFVRRTCRYFRSALRKYRQVRRHSPKEICASR